jgi:hypothetical protein
MAFMALSDLKNAEKTSSILSAFFAISSMMVGTHNLWRHRVKINMNAQEAVSRILLICLCAVCMPPLCPSLLEHVPLERNCHGWWSEAACILP